MFAAIIFLAFLPGAVSVLESSSIHPAARGADEEFFAGEHLSEKQQSVVTFTVPHLSKTFQHVWEKVKSDKVMMGQIRPDDLSKVTSIMEKATKEFHHLPETPVVVQIHLNSAGDGIGVSGPNQKYKPLPNVRQLGHFLGQLKAHEKDLMGVTLGKPQRQPLDMARQMEADLQSLEIQLERGEAGESDEVVEQESEKPEKKKSKIYRMLFYGLGLPFGAAFWMIGMYFMLISIAYATNGGAWYHTVWMFLLGLVIFVVNLWFPSWVVDYI